MEKISRQRQDSQATETVGRAAACDLADRPAGTETKNKQNAVHSPTQPFEFAAQTGQKSGRSEVEYQPQPLDPATQTVVSSYVSSVLTDSVRGRCAVIDNGSNTESINPRAEIGELLKNTRSAKSLTLADVARQTNINQRYLKAIESGQSTQLASTYERGYLHNYAEFLDLEAAHLVAIWSGPKKQEPVCVASGANACLATEKAAAGSAQNLPWWGSAWISALPRWFNGEQKPVAAGGFRYGSSWSRGGLVSPLGVLRATTSAALPLLMLCVVAFAYHAFDSDAPSNAPIATAAVDWQQNQPDKLGQLAHEAVAPAETRPSPETDNADADNVAQNHSLAFNEVDKQPDDKRVLAERNASDTLSAATPASANRVEPQQPVSAQPDRAVEASALADNALSDLPSTLDSATVVPQVRSSGVLTLGEAQHANSALTVPGTDIEDSYEPVGPGAVEMIAQVQMADRLVITVYEDSWVDVRDREGARLYRDLARAGRRIDVSGRLPFSLHIGNAPGLELELNGKPVEITRYRSDNSARLTLASH